MAERLAPRKWGELLKMRLAEVHAAGLFSYRGEQVVVEPADLFDEPLAQLRAPNTAPSLADGGVLMPDLMDAMPEADWGTVLADTFLET